MLTRLRVTGFKNLVDVDVHFGPFTCIVGANGVGKSNLFDAIRFLSALADKSFVDAACSVRDEEAIRMGDIRGARGRDPRSTRVGDVRDIFHQAGRSLTDNISFVAEMIVPPTGVDDLGQAAQAQTTFLRYTVKFRYRQADAANATPAGLELTEEELTYIKPQEVRRCLKFDYTADWRQSVVRTHGVARRSPYVSTGPDQETDTVAVYMHADGSSKKLLGRPVERLLKTVLSTANATENPTAFLARKEMQSWQLLQLEPSALREPDKFMATPRLGPDGSHLPATLDRLARTAPDGDADRVYAGVADRLHDLIQDVRSIGVDRDERREFLSVVAVDRFGTRLPARSLSDGTLRFLALATLEADPEAVGVICFEEPENGIHPDRVRAMVSLLRGIAVDPDLPVELGNPLRQVIVNTHSPAVVQQLMDDEIVAASAADVTAGGVRSQGVVYRVMSGTWRDKLKPRPMPLPPGAILPYTSGPPDDAADDGPAGRPTKPRVIDRMRSLFPDEVGVS